jgi:hypothetical protein
LCISGNRDTNVVTVARPVVEGCVKIRRVEGHESTICMVTASYLGIKVKESIVGWPNTVLVSGACCKETEYINLRSSGASKEDETDG